MQSILKHNKSFETFNMQRIYYYNLKIKWNEEKHTFYFIDCIIRTIWL